MKKLVFLFIAVLFGYLAIRQVEFSRFIQSFDLLNVPLWLFAIGLYLTIPYFSAIRLRLLLSPIKQVSNWTLYRYYLIGIMINQLFPSRAGEFYRAYLISSRENIPYATSLSVIVITRLMDSMLLAFLLLLLLLFLPIQADWVHLVQQTSLVLIGLLCAAVAALAIFPKQMLGIFSQLTRFLPEKFGQRLDTLQQQVIEGIKPVRRLDLLLFSLLLTILMRTLKLGFLLAMLQAFSLPVGLFGGLLVMVLLAFANAISATAGSIGVYHYAMIQALGLLGIGADIALAAAVVAHLTEFVIDIGLGSYFMIRMNLHPPKASSTQTSSNS